MLRAVGAQKALSPALSLGSEAPATMRIAGLLWNHPGSGLASVTHGSTMVQNNSIIFIKRSCGVSPSYIQANSRRIGKRFSGRSI
jgi:hypothetical protein